MSDTLVTTGLPADQRENVTPDSASRLPSGLPRFPLERPQRRVGSIIFMIMVGLPTLLAFIYYDLIAAPQYQTQVTFALRSAADHYSSDNNGGLGAFGPPAGPVSATQSYGLLSYVMSAPAIEDLTQAGVNVKSILDSRKGDVVARLSPKARTEDVLAAWRKMVHMQYDVTKGIISLSTYAFTSDDSYALADGVLRLSEKMANTISLRVQQDAVKYAEETVHDTEGRLTDARQRLSAFRSGTGVVDPERSSQTEVVTEQALRQQLYAAQGQLESLRGSGGEHSPTVSVLLQKISTLQKQISEVERRGGGSGSNQPAPMGGWASVMDTNAALLDQVKEAQTHYDQALNALHELRQSAVRQNAYVLIYVRPVHATEPTFPRLLLTPLVVTGVAFIFWSISVLLFYALRDSR